MVVLAIVAHTATTETSVSASTNVLGEQPDSVRAERKRCVPILSMHTPMLLQTVALALRTMLTPLRGHTDEIPMQKTGRESLCACNGSAAHSAAERPLRSSPLASHIRSKHNGMVKQCI